MALARLDELEEQGDVPPGGAMPLREVWEQARLQLTGEGAGAAVHAPAVDLTALRLDLARVQGEELERLRREAGLPPSVVRELRAELDLQQVRLGERG